MSCNRYCGLRVANVSASSYSSRWKQYNNVDMHALEFFHRLQFTVAVVSYLLSLLS